MKSFRPVKELLNVPWLIWVNLGLVFLHLKFSSFLLLSPGGCCGLNNSQLSEGLCLSLGDSGSSNRPEARNALASPLGARQGHFLLIKGHGLMKNLLVRPASQISVLGGWDSSWPGMAEEGSTS